MPIVTESMVEDAALDWFRALGYQVHGGPDMSPGPDSLYYPLRASHADAVLTSAVRGSLRRLNPDLPEEALDDALRRLTRPEGATLEARNRSFHRMVVDGVNVEYRDADGAVRGAQASVIDFDEPDANTWSAINQFTVSENGNTRRPDIVVFVNGLPLAVMELKNPADENATIWSAFHQLQTYKAELPALFACNAVLLVSDGLQARLGTLSAGREWFKPWRTIGGNELAPAFYTELQVTIEGVFEQHRFLSLLRDFIVFEDDDGGALVKKMAGYHQFHAVTAAVGETLRAAALQQETRRIAETGGRYEAGIQPGGDPGDRRIGVVWHTQGSGKSLTMAFYAGRIIREPAMANPTVVVLTDRNDLDDQLFGTFARCHDLLRQPPVQAASRADLRAK
ncbi:MAG: type I restriction endonuclease, partial [Spirochaetaceae bacterium]|nr:type I restriction endonuclease [Spirochaetaceae bacterium]